MTGEWTELYRPKSLAEVAGNPKALQELREWALEWESGSPRKKAVVLMGSPGTGKTSAALALASDFGWGVLEMNASDQRNAEAIRRIALRGAIADTFTDEGEFLSSREGRLKLIILDEADNIFGREDYGGIPAIAELVRVTRQPVILIVNDFYALSRKSSVLKSGTRQIRFNRIHGATVKVVLRRIAKDQGVKVSERALDLIAENANGDLRSAVKDLQALSLGKKEVQEDETLVLGSRQTTKSMYDLLTEVLHGTNPGRAKSILMDVNEAPEYVMLWIDENLPLEYRDPEDLSRGYGMLSRADVFLGRVTRRQHYGFWSYASDLMSYGVSSAKAKQYKEFARYRFPLFLMKMSRAKGLRGTRDGISRKLGALCHTSIRASRDDILPYFKVAFQKDKDFRIRTSMQLGLDAEELAFLLDEKVDSHPVKHLLSEIEKVTSVQEKGPAPEIEEIALTEEDDREEGGQAAQQRSLFEY